MLEMIWKHQQFTLPYSKLFSWREIWFFKRARMLSFWIFLDPWSSSTCSGRISTADLQSPFNLAPGNLPKYCYCHS